MKTLLCAFIAASLLSFQTSSPIKLAGTSWKGKAMLPDSTQVIMKFTDNSLHFYEANRSDRLLGTATYEQTDSFVSIQAGTGFGPCSKKGSWVYAINRNQGELSFIMIGGPCDENESAIVNKAYLPAGETSIEK